MCEYVMNVIGIEEAFGSFSPFCGSGRGGSQASRKHASDSRETECRKMGKKTQKMRNVLFLSPGAAAV